MSCLYLLQNRIDLVEAITPKLAKGDQPILGLPQADRLQLTHPALRASASGDQPRFFENGNVFGNRPDAHLERGRKFVDGSFAEGKP